MTAIDMQLQAARLRAQAAKIDLDAWSTTLATMEAHRERGCVDQHWSLSTRLAKHQREEARAAYEALADRVATLEKIYARAAELEDAFTEEERTYIGPPPTEGAR